MGRISRLGRIPKILMLGLVLGVIALHVGLSSGPAAQPPGRSPFTSLVSAADRPASILDMTADTVYGQPDFTSDAAPTPPTDSSLANPAAAVVDVATGRIFVADTDNNRVLSWESVDVYQNGDPADLVIGQPNFSSNAAPNPPSATSLNEPSGIAVDYDGTLFVADTGNNRVLMYTPPLDADDYPIYSNGMAADAVLGQPDFASATAANPPDAASLNAPQGITIDNRGNLVVADRNNNRVLGFEPPFESGIEAIYMVGQPRNNNDSLDFTSRIAPNPPTNASLNQPTGVAVGVLGDELYVADSGNNRVLVYNQATGDEIADQVIGQPGFTSRSVPAQPSATSLNGPTGLAVDSADRLYVADTGNNRVLVYPDATASATAAHVFGQNGSFTSGGAPNPPDESSLSGPTGIAPDGIIGIYIADQANQRVLGYDQPLPNVQPRIAAPNPATVRVGHGAFTLEVEGIGFITSSKVLINGVERATTFEAEWLLSIPISAAEVANVSTLNIQVATPAPGGGTSSPAALKVYAPIPGDTTADRVLGWQDFVHNEGEFEPAEATTLFNPSAVAIDQRSGRIFVCDGSNSRVLSWPSAAQFADGQAADLVIGQPDFTSSDPNDIDFGGPGADSNNFDLPMGVAVDASGNLYIADTESNRVLIFEPPFANGMDASMVIGQPDFTADGEPVVPSAANMNFPRGLVVGSDGTLYVADTGQNRVLAFRNPLTSDAVADAVFGQPSFASDTPNNGGASASSLDGPTSVAIDAAGSLYVSDGNNNRVLVFITPTTSDALADRVFGQPNFTSTIPNAGGANGFDTPLGVELDTRGTLYIADNFNNRVLAYANAAAGNTTASRVFGQNGSFTSKTPNLGGVSPTSLNGPIDIASDPNGNLLIADFENSRVLGYDRPGSDGRTYLPLIRK
jgi:sugar lactone lactonase YvrE